MTPADTATPKFGRKIGGADIGVCLTRIHHERFTPFEPVFDEVRMYDAERGVAHEAEVLASLAEVHGGITDIVAGPDASADTRAAMEAGTPIIAGGRLESADGLSVGAPDLLVRIDDGYAAVEIKNHKILATNGITGSVVTLAEITTTGGEPVKFRSARRKDLLQVAHYNRLLAEAGFASHAPAGGVIGSEEPYACVWVDLTKGSPSIQAEYETTFAAIETAIAAGSRDPATPLHGPWWRNECKTCDWAELCSRQLEAVDDVTLLARIDDARRSALASSGIASVAQVADLAPTDDRVPSPAVVLQARARTAGQLLRKGRGNEPLPVPSSRTEIDFDIETYNGEIYLAGFLITTDGVSTFDPVVNWDGTREAEADVVARMFAKLASFSDAGIMVHHWTDYERRTLTEAARRHGQAIPGFASVGDWFDAYAFDLCDWARTMLVSPNGYSLKVIAPLCGFSWRDDDPGGRQSEVWFEHVLAGDENMKQRLLAYNEDDVLAQLAIRRHLRSTPLPSVYDWPP